MPKRDNNGNYIISQVQFWTGVIAFLLVILGMAYGWGCTFTSVQAEVAKNTEFRLDMKEDIKEIRESLSRLSSDVAVLIERTEMLERDR